MNVRHFVFALLCVFILNTVTALAQDANTQKTHYVVGVARGLAPYSFVDENGMAAGYSVDITNAIAEAMQLDIEVIIRPFGELRKAIENGEIDAIPMYYSEKREKLVDFTSPYSTVHNAIFIRKDAPAIETEEDLRGKNIIVINGDIMYDYVLENDITDDLTIVSTESDALQLLTSGEHDCALMAQLPGLYWIKELKLFNIVTVGPLMVPSEICYAVTEGNTKLQNLLSEGLATLGQNGDHRRINDKWLGVLINGSIPASRVLKYIAIVIIPLLLLLAFYIIWSLTLKRQVGQRTLELSKSEERLKSITENASDYIMLVDKNLKIQFINKKVPDLRIEDVIGRSINDFSPKDFQKVANDKFQSVFKTGKPTYYQTEYHDAKGETHYFDVRLSPIIKKGKVISVVSSSNDVTKRKQMENELKEYRDHLEEMVKEGTDNCITSYPVG